MRRSLSSSPSQRNTKRQKNDNNDNNYAEIIDNNQEQLLSISAMMDRILATYQDLPACKILLDQMKLLGGEESKVFISAMEKFNAFVSESIACHARDEISKIQVSRIYNSFPLKNYEGVQIREEDSDEEGEEYTAFKKEKFFSDISADNKKALIERNKINEKIMSKEPVENYTIYGNSSGSFAPINCYKFIWINELDFLDNKSNEFDTLALVIIKQKINSMQEIVMENTVPFIQQLIYDAILDEATEKMNAIIELINELTESAINGPFNRDKVYLRLRTFINKVYLLKSEYDSHINPALFLSLVINDQYPMFANGSFLHAMDYANFYHPNNNDPSFYHTPLIPSLYYHFLTAIGNLGHQLHDKFHYRGWFAGPPTKYVIYETINKFVNYTKSERTFFVYATSNDEKIKKIQAIHQEHVRYLNNALVTIRDTLAKQLEVPEGEL